MGYHYKMNYSSAQVSSGTAAQEASLRKAQLVYLGNTNPPAKNSSQPGGGKKKKNNVSDKDTGGSVSNGGKGSAGGPSVTGSD